MPFLINSPAFIENGPIPRQFTCEGSDVSPALSWSGAPRSTKSFVLIVDDPDAPDPSAPRRTWVHWVVYNLPPDTQALAPGQSKEGLPSGALQGTNDWNKAEYGGPCPPIGRHRYFHKLYALDTVLPDLGKPSKATLLNAMKGHVLAEVQLVGTYQKGS